MTSKQNNEFYLDWEERKNGNKILIINSGSSSVKLTLFEKEANLRRLVDANLKEINSPAPKLSIISSRGKVTTILERATDIPESLEMIFKVLSENFQFQASSLLGIGHRFVHGGSRFEKSCRFTPLITPELEKLLPLAPLHNASCLAGILTCQKIFPAVPQTIVFDTAFHSGMPELAANYAIPLHLAKVHQIKRYGFHGIAYAYLWQAYANLVGPDAPKSKIIALQLGNGCSAAAISGGRSIDTSMGFSPAEGLVMGTRAGDIDAAVMEYLCRIDGCSPVEVLDTFNGKSGLLGFSAISSDMETLLKLYPTNEKAKLAVDLFCYRIVKYLGAYLAALGGAQAIIFSGGIGENAAFIRHEIVSRMAWCGWDIDSQANQKAVGLRPGMMQKISSDSSSIGVYVASADENIFIAAEVLSSF